MANERESLVTVVIDNKLKMLRSLTKKVCGRFRGFQFSWRRQEHHRRRSGA